MPKMRIFVKQDCLSCIRTADIPKEDIEWLKERGLSPVVACTKCTKGFDLVLDDAQWLRERNLELVSNCRDCGAVFSIYPDEAIWLLENDLKLFRRCPECREKNKRIERALVNDAVAEMNAEDLALPEEDHTIEAETPDGD